MDEPNPAPHLCECGCGQPAPLATVTVRKRGVVKGHPQRFIQGHSSRGRNHYAWREEGASYQTIHRYLRTHYPKAGVCEDCGKVCRTDFALIKGHEYSRDRSDYMELCRRCHVFYDELGYCGYWKKLGKEAPGPSGDAPSCKCGCGSAVLWNKPKRRWNQYATGHYRSAASYKNEAWLRREYVTKRRTLYEIADECGVNRTTISHFMDTFGIEVRNASDAHLRR